MGKAHDVAEPLNSVVDVAADEPPVEKAAFGGAAGVF
jgi:hypothetical protein